MALREIVKLPNQVLRRKAHKLTDFGPDIQKLIDDMIETMRNEPGVGLAAPQVNVSLQLIVVEYPDDDTVEDSPSKLYIVANPEITKRSSEMVKGVEGCLSVPNLLGEVERCTEISVKGLDKSGKKLNINSKGWLARIFQHEIDHLNGVLFVDRALALYQPEEIKASETV